MDIELDVTKLEKIMLIIKSLITLMILEFFLKITMIRDNGVEKKHVVEKRGEIGK